MHKEGTDGGDRVKLMTVGQWASITRCKERNLSLVIHTDIHLGAEQHRKREKRDARRTSQTHKASPSIIRDPSETLSDVTHSLHPIRQLYRKINTPFDFFVPAAGGSFFNVNNFFPL